MSSRLTTDHRAGQHFWSSPASFGEREREREREEEKERKRSELVYESIDGLIEAIEAMNGIKKKRDFDST